MIHYFQYNPIFFKMLISCFRDIEFYKEDDTIKCNCDSIISLSELLNSNSVFDYYDIACKLFHFSHVIFSFFEDLDLTLSHIKLDDIFLINNNTFIIYFNTNIVTLNKGYFSTFSISNIDNFTSSHLSSITYHPTQLYKTFIYSNIYNIIYHIIHLGHIDISNSPLAFKLEYLNDDNLTNRIFV